MTPSEFRKDFDAVKTRMIGLPYGEKNYDDTLSRLRLILEHNGQTTDRWTDYQCRASVCWRAIKIVRFWFGTLQHILNPMTVTRPKVEIFKLQDGGGRHLENRFFRHNSSTDCPISAKFCTRKRNGIPTKAVWQILQILQSKMADGHHFENH